MSPRASEPPRRGPEPRRGASRAVDPADPVAAADSDESRGRGFDGIADARAYTPRGRTIRENGERGAAPRTGRAGDPFRPALQVLDGGQPAVRDRRRAAAEPSTPPPRRAGAERTAAPDRAAETDRAGRAADRAVRADRASKADRAERAGKADRADRPDRADPTGRRRTAAAEPHGRRAPSGVRAPGRAPTAGQGGSAGAAASPRGRTTAAEPRSRDTAARRTDGPGRQSRSPAPRRGGADRLPPRPKRLVRAEAPPLADTRRRLRIGTVLALALFTAIGIRLITLQVIDTPAYAQSVLEQRQNRLMRVVLPAPRGSIRDRYGEELARSTEARYIYADPELVKDPAGTAKILSPLLLVAPSRLAQLMARKTRPGGGASRFEYLARGVDVAVADKISALNLPGIRQHRDERREVPGADLAANLIGFTGEDRNGLEGLEARYDDVLRGRNGERVFEAGNPHSGKGELAKEIPGGYNRQTLAQPGTSLELTIDRDLQYEVQGILAAQLRKVRATIGAAVVIDVRTGEVLAQASHPTYNAAKPFDSKPTDREDVATSVIADPGSTHKAFIFGAALQEGIIKPDSSLTVGPALSRGGYRFQDTHPHPKGTRVTIPGLLAYSSNVGTILLADKLTPRKVYEYQRRFGLGAPTGVGMPGEASGRLLAPNEWSPSGSGSIPVGHSVDATLIQMAAGYAAIANDGTYIQPHLIRATIAADGTRTPAAAPARREVLSPANAAALRTMMEAVVDVPGATGNLAQVTGYRVAGKTGTGKRLVNGKYTSYEAGSFIGMAPADNPRYVIAVFADTPGGGGGAVAGPAFSKMMALTLAHYLVPPSGSKSPKFTICPQPACW